MKRLIPLLIMISFVAVANGEVVESIIARVGDRIITRSQYINRLERGYEEIDQTNDVTDPAVRKAKFRENLLHEMINELLIKDRADRLGLTVSDKEVQQAVERLKKQYNIQSEEQFEKSIEQSGLSRQQLESRLRDTLLTNKLFARELRPRADLTDKDLRIRYEKEKERYRLPDRAKLREIVIMFPQGADQATRDEIKKRADEVAEMAKKGENFASLVARYSDAPSKQNGGLLGIVNKGDLQADMDAAVFSAKPGTVVGPIESKVGYHILLVEERHPSEIPSFDEIKAKLRKESSDEAFQRDLKSYLDSLRKDAFVQIFKDRIPGDVPESATGSTK